MAKIVQVDEDFRIKIIPDNYILQRKIKTKNNSSAWRSESYHSDLASLSLEYLERAPRRAGKATACFQELLEAVKTAERNIKKLIVKFQNNENQSNVNRSNQQKK